MSPRRVSLGPSETQLDPTEAIETELPAAAAVTAPMNSRRCMAQLLIGFGQWVASSFGAAKGVPPISELLLVLVRSLGNISIGLERDFCRSSSVRLQHFSHLIQGIPVVFLGIRRHAIGWHHDGQVPHIRVVRGEQNA